jgi:L-threonylcarbamoyladenylate synthase
MITTNLDKAISALNQGELVAIPTETVYGLAANAFTEDAVNKIFSLKNRPSFNPLIVHIKSIDYLDNIAQDIPEKAIILAKHFWPGPLTLVLTKKDTIPEAVTGGKNTVAIRVPNHPTALELLNKLNFPLAAPSANPFGSISPTTSQHVQTYFGDKLEVILEGGTCKNGLESTIIGFDNNEAILYRHGAITINDVEKVIGKIGFKTKDNKKPEAPGMLSKHYAPKKETFLTNNVKELYKNFTDKKVGFILFKDFFSPNKNCYKEILSEIGNLEEAAMNLYKALHQLDNSDCDIIIAERFPDEGLGKTINDRLERAVKK